MVRSRGISSEQVKESIYSIPANDSLAKACLDQPETRWVPFSDLASISLSAPHRRWIEALLDL